VWKGGRPRLNSSFERRHLRFLSFSYCLLPFLPDSAMQKQISKKGELKVHRRLFYKPLTNGDTCKNPEWRELNVVPESWSYAHTERRKGEICCREQQCV